MAVKIKFLLHKGKQIIKYVKNDSSLSKIISEDYVKALEEKLYEEAWIQHELKKQIGDLKKKEEVWAYKIIMKDIRNY